MSTENIMTHMEKPWLPKGKLIQLNLKTVLFISHYAGIIIANSRNGFFMQGRYSEKQQVLVYISAVNGIQSFLKIKPIKTVYGFVFRNMKKKGNPVIFLLSYKNEISKYPGMHGCKEILGPITKCLLFINEYSQCFRYRYFGKPLDRVLSIKEFIFIIDAEQITI